ncbi:MAG: branched-chain alpha-keto acid dehydrogenase subunit E2 [Dehalococcoidia bacterium]|nr:branched-chain alpha-keto acid dehydrogenase subunit E2 [Dehalococcoidia bacterium]
MALEFRLPSLGEGIIDADVLRVLVAVGDEVRAEQAVMEIETDKATIDVPAPSAGRVAAIYVKPGDNVAVGALLLTLQAAGTSTAAPAASAPAAAPVAPATPPASAGAPTAVMPAAVEVPPVTPVPVTPASMPAPAAPPPAATEGSPGAFASPSIRRFAREIGIDLVSVQGSGPGGRISEDDVKRAAREARRGQPSTVGPGTPEATPSGPAPVPTGGIDVPPLPDFAQFGPVESEPLSRFRRTVARNMATSWAIIPHVTLHREVDVTELEELRQRYKQRAADAGGSLTVTVILLKIVAAALKAHPRMNASLDLEGGELVLKKYYDIGVAVDTPRGLTVPVIRDVDEKNIIELSVELSALAAKARNGDLTVEEMRGATFTLTNLGGIGIGEFTPIINWPEVGVLGVGRAERRPVWVNEKWEPRLRMPLSLSHDHRVIDGADGARFLTWIEEAIAEPLLIAMEG